MVTNIQTLLVAVIIGWLTAMSLLLVGYLVSLEIVEWRRNRRMAARREQLGLTHSRHPA